MKKTIMPNADAPNGAGLTVGNEASKKKVKAVSKKIANPKQTAKNNTGSSGSKPPNPGGDLIFYE